MCKEKERSEAASSSQTVNDSEAMWPEDPNDNISLFCQIFQRFTYSYMDSLLRKGSRQTLDDGTHLSQDDLFPVPRTMKSRYLSGKFR